MSASANTPQCKRWGQLIGVHPESETRTMGTVLNERTDAQEEITCVHAFGEAGNDAEEEFAPVSTCASWHMGSSAEWRDAKFAHPVRHTRRLDLGQHLVVFTVRAADFVGRHGEVPRPQSHGQFLLSFGRPEGLPETPGLKRLCRGGWRKPT